MRTYRTRRRQFDFGFVLVFGLIAAIMVGGLATWIASAQYNERTMECTVTDKDRGHNAQTGSSEYRVYTTCGTFSNEDNMLRGKWDSGDIQGQLEVGDTYHLTVAGPRIPFLSMFPNIYEVEPAMCPVGNVAVRCDLTKD